jgi:hypothetical protein
VADDRTEVKSTPSPLTRAHQPSKAPPGCATRRENGAAVSPQVVSRTRVVLGVEVEVLVLE